MVKAITCLFLFIASIAYGQPSSDRPVSSTGGKKAHTDQRGTEKSPLVVKTLATPKSQEETDREAKESKEKSDLERATLGVSHATLDVNKAQLSANVWQTFFNGLLLVTSAIAAFITWRAANAARDAAIAARDSADIAFKATIPILVPYVRAGEIHPLLKTITRHGDGPERSTFTSAIFFTFDNAGKSPAIVRDVRAQLFLLPEDDIPQKITFQDLAHHSFQPIIPGGTSKGRGTTSVIDYKQDFDISPEEFDELLSDADPVGRYQRMALIGRVIYDDFFGWRHTRNFCVKMRYWRTRRDEKPNFFQAQFGGHAYTKIETKKIPSPDPLEA